MEERRRLPAGRRRAGRLYRHGSARRLGWAQSSFVKYGAPHPEPRQPRRGEAQPEPEEACEIEDDAEA
jgi:hypothetical protein